MSLFGEECKSRRELLWAFGRLVALGCLACVGGMAARKKRLPQQGETCRKPSLCHGCRVFHSCKLPQAVSARQSGKEQSHG
jgi:hypothetical protein